MASQGFSIGVLARQSGVHLETIRYYERIGLTPAPSRTEAGHRLYDPLHKRRLEFIRRGRELGFGIEDIRTLLALAEKSDQPCEVVRVIAGDHLREVRAKIADLSRLERILAEQVDRCHSVTGGAECPVLEMLEGG